MRAAGAAIALLLMALCWPGAAARAASPAETLDSASSVLDAMLQAPDRGMAADMLRNAQAVVVLPDVINAGLIIGGRRGHGVLCERTAEGWSDPVFITLTGASLGLQAGASSTDILLVFRTQAGLDSLLDGKYLLGTDLAVAAGPVGRNVSAGTDGKLDAEVYAVARARGLYVGYSLQGASLKMDEDANTAFWGAQADLGAVLDGRLHSRTPALQRFRERLTGYTTR